MQEFTEVVRAVADLIRAFAELVLPIGVLLVVLSFRREVPALLRRLTRAEGFGAKAEFTNSLDRLRESMNVAAAEVERAVAEQSLQRVDEAANPSMEQEATAKTERKTEVIDRILLEAATSPKVALMLLSTEIEREVRQVRLSHGIHVPHETVQRAVRDLAEKGLSPRSIAESLELFQEVCNRIVHGGAGDDDEILRAIDSGLTLFRAL